MVIIDVSSILMLLYDMVMGNVASSLEIHVTTIFKVEVWLNFCECIGSCAVDLKDCAANPFKGHRIHQNASGS